MADSVSVFSEGTFEEQILELANYIAQPLPEEERTSFTKSIQDALQVPEGGKTIEQDEEKRKYAFSSVLAQVKSLGSGNEREIEGFFNLLFSHLFNLKPADSEEAKQDVLTLLQTIVSSPSESISIKFRILSNLFNATPRSSPLRLSIYSTLLDLAVQNGQLSQIQPSLPEVERWLSQWNISGDEKSAFWRSLVDAFSKSSQPDLSYQFLLHYLRTLSPSSPNYNSAAVEAITTALRLPSVFDFDPLFKLDAVIAAKDHELFPLLQIFINKGLSEFQDWKSSHSDIFSKYDLDPSALEHKIKLLSLTSLAFNNIGKDVPYSQVASAIQVDTSEVEKWVIHSIRAGLVSGRLSQTKQTVHITRSTARGFEREQWELLEQRLVSWKTGLTDVLEIVAGARRQSAGHVSASTQTAAA